MYAFFISVHISGPLDENCASNNDQQNEEYQNDTCGSPNAVAAAITSIYFTHLKSLLPPLIRTYSSKFRILSCESDDECFGNNNEQNEKY
jgi:hypothetical protein